GDFDTNRAMTIPADMLSGARGLFSSASIDGDSMSLALRWAQEKGGQVIDPHSAVGLAAARQLDIDADIPVVTLATAHPAKFREAVERATGVRPALPARLGNLFDREERYTKLPGDYDAVKAFVLAEAARG
ncbi:MAG: threonine synthase, partial [Sphingopyxis sp.]